MQEKAEQIFLAQPQAHQLKLAEMNKMLPTDSLQLVAFFKQCQTVDKVAGVLDKSMISQGEETAKRKANS